MVYIFEHLPGILGSNLQDRKITKAASTRLNFVRQTLFDVTSEAEKQQGKYRKNRVRITII